jgi:hypothetical protein
MKILFSCLVSDDVLAAIRTLFNVASPEDDEIDEALTNQSGAHGLDLVEEVARTDV